MTEILVKQLALRMNAKNLSTIDPDFIDWLLGAAKK
jgi:hypothetical protein